MAAAPSRPSILTVENDEETRHLYVDILASTGARIIEAGNPYEAFDHLRTNHSITLIVTDIGMPGGGLDYLAKLRRDVAACPIIVITGLGGARLRHDAITAGATEFLEKPVRAKQLRETVERLLDPR